MPKSRDFFVCTGRPGEGEQVKLGTEIRPNLLSAFRFYGGSSLASRGQAEGAVLMAYDRGDGRGRPCAFQRFSAAASSSKTQLRPPPHQGGGQGRSMAPEDRGRISEIAYYGWSTPLEAFSRSISGCMSCRVTPDRF